MNDSRAMQKVGAPDPELENSPIAWESDEDFDVVRQEIDEGVCYFNGQVFEIGDFVCSGDELLRCEERGVWVREGSCQEN